MIKSHKLILSIIVFVILSFHPSFAQTTSQNQHKELGTAKWHRDYEQAIIIAEKEKKSILILFQEVPGCSTCRNYGHNVLSNPLLVEAIENSFIPLAIFNNKGGKDKQILNKFNEPSWNNPVIRIINTKGNNLTERIGSDYSAISLCKKMKEVLSKTNKPIPEYLNLLEQELLPVTQISEINYTMGCFWTGEKQLGKAKGVLNVESGFINQKEVVKVKYNNAIIDKSELTNYAKKQGFNQISNSESYRTAINDVHYYLLHSNYKYIPLSELQKTKINSALGSQQSAEKYLSPQQKEWFNLLNKNSIEKSNSFHDKEIKTAWKLMLKNTKSNN